MLSKKENKSNQVQIICIDDLVPKTHLLRKIEKAIDWNFIYELVEDKYSKDNGRPSIDPVTLIKMPILQYLYGIKSMRQTIKEIEVNVAYAFFTIYIVFIKQTITILKENQATLLHQIILRISPNTRCINITLSGITPNTR